MSAMMSPQSWEKLTSNDSFASNVTPTVLTVVAWRQKKKSVKGDPDQEI
jgi:hypothetical protein